ncbi:LCP family protein [Microbispora corallina]|uniref:LCP family protein n=1 Tax=Microbispora corallina TaxID=83302 RepID=UPI001EF29AB3|nr:LCP family protein [Microbispora corallina]
MVTVSTRRAAALLGWVGLSVVLPGAAHLRAGWRRTGLVLMGSYLTVLVCLVAVSAGADAGLAGRVLGWLTQLAVAALACALAWFCLVVHSYAVLRPGRLPRIGQVLTGAVAGVLAVAVATPFAFAAQYLAVSQRTLDAVFAGRDRAAGGTGDPWDGRDRVNVLLLGGDSGADRVGMRTDSINVASVDVHTGRTVLLGLPRNLEHVPFPPGSPMALRFPYGFTLPEYKPGWREDLLFSVWQYAEEHPELFGGREHMGAETLKETIGYILGMRIDWYALVNIGGFAKIVDALGGLVLTVDRNIVYGKYDEGVVPAGTRRLTGAEALWYARSRTYSDDFSRMRRQRCVLGALVRQADPGTVLSRFTQLAAATRTIVHTDIPRPMLEALVPLTAKVKQAGVTSLQFIPPVINTAYPDWDRIRLLTARAIRQSERPGQRRHRLDPGTEQAEPTATPVDEGCGAV